MKTSLLLASLPLVLAGCASTPPVSDELAHLLDNPLYAERYYENMTDHLVDLVISNDPLATDDATRGLIDDLREEALTQATAANARQTKGIIGSIVSNDELAAGEVILLDGMLYFGPSFFVEPGPNLHVYLSTILDPTTEFPDASAVELGSLKTILGSQQYEAPEAPVAVTEQDPTNWRTMVLWDETFHRIYGFAQIRPY